MDYFLSHASSFLVVELRLKTKYKAKQVSKLEFQKDSISLTRLLVTGTELCFG